MSKPIILSMNRNKKRIDIKFKRNIEFVDLYLHLLNFLKIDVHDEFYKYRNKKGEIDKNYFFEKKEDILDWFKEDFTFEIFFGHKNVFVVFESDENMQKKFINEVNSNSDWLKPQ
jgi:hypothetical protein